MKIRSWLIIAYWMSFALAFIDNGFSIFRWRFPRISIYTRHSVYALHSRPLRLATLLCLGRVVRKKPKKSSNTCGTTPTLEFIGREFLKICVVSTHTKSVSPVEFAKILMGLDKSRAPHLGRQAWLCVWIQIMASWTGITVVIPRPPRTDKFRKPNISGLSGA
ncbi:hypothetical protein L218DRAFT_747707 [Marasmius fiardii PR-910]|nr:hypothetical protein L218DRAFT_747707 [Marasmius fiardii PR-910]